MGFSTRLLTGLVGFAFAFGALGQASAQDVKVGSDGAVVIAREKRLPTMSASVEEFRKSVMVLAENGQPPTKPTKDKTKSPTKPKNA